MGRTFLLLVGVGLLLGAAPLWAQTDLEALTPEERRPHLERALADLAATDLATREAASAILGRYRGEVLPLIPELPRVGDPEVRYRLHVLLNDPRQRLEIHLPALVPFLVEDRWRLARAHPAHQAMLEMGQGMLGPLLEVIAAAPALDLAHYRTYGALLVRVSLRLLVDLAQPEVAASFVEQVPRLGLENRLRIGPVTGRPGLAPEDRRVLGLLEVLAVLSDRPDEQAAFQRAAQAILADQPPPIEALSRLLESKKAEVRRFAVAEVAAHGVAGARPVLEQALQDGAAVVRREAAGLAGELGVTHLVPHLEALWRAPKQDVLVRQAAVISLGRLGQERLVPELIDQLAGPQPARLEAGTLEALGWLGTAEARRALMDVTGLERTIAWEALALRPHEESARYLGMALLSSDSDDERRWLLELMARQAGTTNGRSWVEAMLRKGLLVRAGIDTLVRMGAVDAAPTLMQIIRHSVSTVERTRALQALAELDAIEARPFLRDFMLEQRYGQTLFLQTAIARIRLGDESAVGEAGSPNMLCHELNSLGIQYLRDEHYEQAIEIFEWVVRADVGSFYDEIGYYNLACTYALMGDPEEAIAQLEVAIQTGFDDVRDWHWMRADADLDPLRPFPAFRSLVDGLGERLMTTRRR